MLEPPEDRADPFCPYFGTCGGCQYQHVRYPAQLEFKRAVVVEQLQRIGGFADADALVRPTLGMVTPWEYRNHARFSLGRRYGEVEAVQDLDLEIPAGQIVGLLGPNGAGKSTTVRMLAAMLPPTTGRAEVCGHDVVAEPARVKALVGYVPESGAVFETLTGREYLDLVAALHRLPPAFFER